MSKVLITGSSGYIGSHLLKRIIRDSLYSVLGLDKENPDKVYPDRFYYGDIRNDKYLKYK